MAARRANGEGSISKRRDGRWEGAIFLPTASGRPKRIRFYTRTRREAHQRLSELQTKAHQGVPVPDTNWRIGEYLDYWLENVVRPNRRPATFEQYKWAIQLYLKPGLGSYPLTRLSVPVVQNYLNQQLKAGHSVRKVQIMRAILSTALNRAQREELIGRNVAQLAELPAWERAEVEPWSVGEAKQFLSAAWGDSLYPAFVLLVLYGLRRGEVLGLRWCDVDLEHSVLSIRQQVQRVGGKLYQSPVKTKASRRDLPLLPIARSTLASLERTGTREGLIFTTQSGKPIEPRNFARSFHRICARHGIRVIRVHDVRHSAATLLKNLGVPARDAQAILGHSRISTTQEIYQHGDRALQFDALEKVEQLLWQSGDDSTRCRQLLPSGSSIVERFTSSISGGAMETRTPDLLHAIYRKDSQQQGWCEVRTVLRDYVRSRLAGVVAVTAAVSIDLDVAG